MFSILDLKGIVSDSLATDHAAGGRQGPLADDAKQVALFEFRQLRRALMPPVSARTTL